LADAVFGSRIRIKSVIPSEARNLGVDRTTAQMAQAKTKIPRSARDDNRFLITYVFTYIYWRF
jgi:hypothetical protein